MTLTLQLLGSFLLIFGTIFCFLGAIGALRFPDFYTRVHATSLTDSFGAIFILIGLMMFTNCNMVTIKLIFILVFILITSPVAAYAMVNAAWNASLLPWQKSSHKIANDELQNRPVLHSTEECQE